MRSRGRGISRLPLAREALFFFRVLGGSFTSPIILTHLV